MATKAVRVAVAIVGVGGVGASLELLACWATTVVLVVVVLGLVGIGLGKIAIGGVVRLLAPGTVTVVVVVVVCPAVGLITIGWGSKPLGTGLVLVLGVAVCGIGALLGLEAAPVGGILLLGDGTKIVVAGDKVGNGEGARATWGLVVVLGRLLILLAVWGLGRLKTCNPTAVTPTPNSNTAAIFAQAKRGEV